MIIDPEAVDELEAAAAWYDDQREGLGGELLDAVESILEHLAEHPEAFPVDRFDDRARRANLARFPYALVFMVHRGEVRVVAFCHAKRLPGYWRRRV